MYELNGKVALVTGGGTGIGQAICRSLAESGADIAFTYLGHSPEATTAEVEEQGRRVKAMMLDARDPVRVNDVVAETVAAFGRLDVVVANAGGLLRRVPIATMTDEQWHEVISTNLSSVFYLARASLGHMRDGGRIIFISSMAAVTGGGAGSGGYTATKAGMVGLTRGLAKEVAARGIAVTAVAPGLILGTPFHETFTPPEDQARAISRIPLGRAGAPSDVAAVVCFLASDASSFLTGQVIRTSGAQELT